MALVKSKIIRNQDFVQGQIFNLGSKNGLLAHHTPWQLSDLQARSTSSTYRLLSCTCSASCKRQRLSVPGQVGSEGGVQEAALRPYWRGRMGTSKQEQLDLFEGRLPSDEDFSDTDQEEQGSPNQQRVITAAQDLSTQPRSFSSWPSHESAEASSEQVSHQCSCHSEDITASSKDPEHDERSPTDPRHDSSSSGEDTSSSSGSDSNSSSDEDPDGVPPIQIRQALYALVCTHVGICVKQLWSLQACLSESTKSIDCSVDTAAPFVANIRQVSGLALSLHTAQRTYCVETCIDPPLLTSTAEIF